MQTVKLSQICPPKSQINRRKKEWQILKKSIQKQGQLNFIICEKIICPCCQKTIYILVDGVQRYDVFCFLKKETILVYG